jgi:predicted permease
LIGFYFVLSGFHSRGFALPILFMNAGNMGIPLALFAFGPAGMQRATLLYVFSAFLQYSLGIYILNGRANWIEIFRLPLIYAAVGGVYFNLMHIRIPEALAQPINMLGQRDHPMDAD